MRENRALHRSLATFVAAILLIQATGPSYAALRNETTAKTDHGHPAPAHHPGCPWEGTGDCPHAHGDVDGPRLVSCGDDDALSMTDAQRAFPIVSEPRADDRIDLRFENALRPPPPLDAPDPDRLLDAPPPRERAA